MEKFSDYLKINEGLGGLKGLPQPFIKALTSKYAQAVNGLAGENSKVELFKSNAKRKDVTAATKKVGGYVNPKDRGNRRYSQAEIEAQYDKKNYAGVIIKIDGEWAFLAAFDEYGDGGGNFLLVDANDNKKSISTTKNFSNGSKRNLAVYNRTYLKASELNKFIDFENDLVDVYLVTTDPVRMYNKQKQEEERKQLDSISPERRKALIKFLQSKSQGVIDEISRSLLEESNKINQYISKFIERAISGKPVSGEGTNIDDMVSTLKKKLSTIQTIGFHIEQIVKNGEIKSWNGEDEYNYKEFKNLIKELKNSEI